MKKLLVFLLAWFLLGQMSLEEWNGMNTDVFMKQVAHHFAQQNKCDSEVVAITNEIDVFIFGRCREVPEVDPDKIVGRR